LSIIVKSAFVVNVKTVSIYYIDVVLLYLL